ncbi:hypothetical protein CBL_02038 [Carabus blaptoides fortunei]
MNGLVLVFAVVLAVANAGHYGIGLAGPGAPGAAIQAPSAHATIVGPDGSHIGSAAGGGAVVANGIHGGGVSAAIVPGAIGLGYGHGIGAIGGLGFGIAGAGHEGQYIPSGLEHLYDDGSYRAEHHLEGLWH